MKVTGEVCWSMGAEISLSTPSRVDKFDGLVTGFSDSEFAITASDVTTRDVEGIFVELGTVCVKVILGVENESVNLGVGGKVVDVVVLLGISARHMNCTNHR